MFRMEIAFDEEKIRREGKYDISKMWAMIVEFMLKKYRLKKTAPGVYSDYSGYDGYGVLMGFAAWFENYSWFMDNIEKWHWVEADDDTPDDIYVEDWKTAIKARRAAS
jgi:hypothetical protein